MKRERYKKFFTENINPFEDFLSNTDISQYSFGDLYMLLYKQFKNNHHLLNILEQAVKITKNQGRETSNDLYQQLVYGMRY